MQTLSLWQQQTGYPLDRLCKLLRANWKARLAAQKGKTL
jgi:hypothetical protein